MITKIGNYLKSKNLKGGIENGKIHIKKNKE